LANPAARLQFGRVLLTMAVDGYRNTVTRTSSRTRNGSILLRFLFLAPLSAPLGKPSAANPQVAESILAAINEAFIVLYG